MNCSVYIIGADNDGIMHAYPDDYATQEIFKKFVLYIKGDTLFAIHRNGSSFYHLWYRKTTNGYLGICVLLTGVWFMRTDILRQVCENEFSSIAVNGKLLRVDNDGHIRTNANLFANNSTEINNIELSIRGKITEYSKYCTSAPPQNASSDPLSIQSLPHEADYGLFSTALKTYRSVYATYGKGGGNINQLLQQIENIARVRDNYYNKCKELENKCDTIKKSKNRYATVIALTCLLLIGSIIAIISITTKNQEIAQKLAIIQDNEETIKNQNDTISVQKNTILENNRSISELEKRVSDLETDNTNLLFDISSLRSDRSNIISHKPFIVTNTDFNWRNGVLTVYYYAPKNASQNVRCMVIRETDNTEIYNKTYNFNSRLHSGHNSFTLRNLTGLNGSMLYRFEIYSDGKFCGGGRH